MEQHTERWAGRAELPDGGEDEARGRCLVFQSIIDLKLTEIMATYFPSDQLDEMGRLIPQVNQEPTEP